MVYEPVAWGVAYETGDDAALQSFVAAGFFDDARGGSAEWMGGFVDFWGGTGTWEALGEAGRAQMLKASRKTFEEVRALCFDFTPASAYASLGCPDAGALRQRITADGAARVRAPERGDTGRGAQGRRGRGAPRRRPGARPSSRR